MDGGHVLFGNADNSTALSGKIRVFLNTHLPRKVMKQELTRQSSGREIGVAHF
jgi:hypothetical protein